MLEELRPADALHLRYRRVSAGEELETGPLDGGTGHYVITLRFENHPEIAEQSERLKEILDLRRDLDEFFLTSNPTHHSPRRPC